MELTNVRNVRAECIRDVDRFEGSAFALRTLVRQHFVAHEAAIRAEYKELLDAAEIFAAYIAFLHAADTMGDFEKPLTKHDVVTGYMGNGASIRLHVGDFDKLASALDDIERT